jgi:hypothetical protein
MNDAKETLKQNFKSYGWLLVVVIVAIAALISIQEAERSPVSENIENFDVRISNISISEKNLFFSLNSDYNGTISQVSLCLDNDKYNESCTSTSTFNFSEDNNLSLDNFTRSQDPVDYDLTLEYKFEETIELDEKISINARPESAEVDQVNFNESEDTSEPGDGFFSGGSGGSSGGSGGSGDGTPGSNEEEYQEPYFNVNEINYSHSIEAGEGVVFTAEIENLGKKTDTQELELLVEGEREYFLPELTLIPGEVNNENLVWPTEFDYSGNYSYTIKTENETREGVVYVGSWEAPTAEIQINNTKPDAGETIGLDASNSEPGDGDITDYIWHVNKTKRTGPQIEATPDEGLYEIRLKVIDSIGETDTETRTINVTE